MKDLGDSVAVVIPVHDRPHLLRRAVESVLAQSKPASEVIIVDDTPGGLDRSFLEYGGFPRVQLVRSTFRHACRSRNLGAKSSVSEWIAFLDHDDWVEPQWLSSLMAAGSDPNTDYALRFCGAVYRNGKGEPLKFVRPSRRGPAYGDQTVLFLAGAFLMRRDLFWAVGGYDDELPASQQTELGLRAIRALAERGWSTAFTPEILVNLQSRPRSERKLRQDQTVSTACVRILARHDKILAHDPPALASLHRTAARCFARLGELGPSLRHWAGASNAQFRHRSNLTLLAFITIQSLKYCWKLLAARRRDHLATSPLGPATPPEVSMPEADQEAEK